MINRRWLPAAIALAGFLVAAGCGDDAPTQGGNLPPRIVSVNVSPASVILNGEARVTALVSDPDGDVLTVHWRATGGGFVDSTRTSTTWKAPDAPGSFILTFFASDGRESVSDSVDVLAGNVSLTVLSDPPGAFINLDGVATGLATPRTFDPLPVGFHSASMFSQFYRYQSLPGREMVHGDHDTLLFELTEASSVALATGRSDLLEIGGVAFLPSGLGVIYVGRSASETALYSTPLFPAGGTPQGVRLLGDVRFSEPIAMGTAGPDLFFVAGDDSLMAMAVRDLNQDGVVDSLGTPRGLRKAYAPAVSRDGSTRNERIAYGIVPSDDTSSLQLFWGTYANGTFAGTQLATPNAGRFPTWKPDEDILAFVRDEIIFRSSLNPGGLPQADTLFARGRNAAPAWGVWGAKTLAILHGEEAGPLTDLVLTATNAPDAVTVYQGFSDPRFVAWSPLERAVVVTHHPGGTPRMVIVRELPIP